MSNALHPADKPDHYKTRLLPSAFTGPPVWNLVATVPLNLEMRNMCQQSRKNPPRAEVLHLTSNDLISRLVWRPSVPVATIFSDSTDVQYSLL